MLSTPQTLTLSLKGVPPVAPFFSTAVWDRWPDQWSPNCAVVLQSMVPALVHKSLGLCIHALCREYNIRAIAMGCGYKKYKWVWWYLPLKCRLEGLGLLDLCEYQRLKKWAREGAHVATTLGRGGGCTHTQDQNF